MCLFVRFSYACACAPLCPFLRGGIVRWTSASGSGCSIFFGVDFPKIYYFARCSSFSLDSYQLRISFEDT